jgi:hypothetical protein
MKKFLSRSAGCMAILLAIACGKDDNQPTPQSTEDFIVADIGGDRFESVAGGTLQSLLQLFDILSIGGVVLTNPADSSGTVLSLTFQTRTGNPIPTGDYTFVYNGSADCDLLQDDVCGTLAYGLTDGPTVMTYTSAGPTGRFEVQIQAIDLRVGGIVQGTFSGIVLDADGNALPVSDGAFQVRIR